MKLRGTASLLTMWAALLAFTGCDSTFEPLEESKWVFSIAGHLNPSADTQWVRVNSLRPVVGTSPDPIDAVVTLEELETGKVVVLSSALATYRPVLQGAASQYAFNFWTAEPIRPGFSYRLTATRSDGAASHATVSIPSDDFSMTYAKWVWDASGLKDEVWVEGVPDLAMVLLSFKVAPGCAYRDDTFSDYQRLVADPVAVGGVHVVGLDWDPRPSFLETPPNCNLLNERIVVVASGDPWPFVASSALRDLMHPNMVGNVENGTGYLAGLLLRSHPRERCSLRLPLQEYCEIRYDSRSAMLGGTVQSLCTGNPIVGAQVVLEELTGNRLRGAESGSSGGYRIEGLEPGLAYRLVVTHPSYITYQSPTLTFEVAEERLENTVRLSFGEGHAC